MDGEEYREGMIPESVWVVHGRTIPEVLRRSFLSCARVTERATALPNKEHCSHLLLGILIILCKNVNPVEKVIMHNCHDVLIFGGKYA